MVRSSVFNIRRPVPAAAPVPPAAPVVVPPVAATPSLSERQAEAGRTSAAVRRERSRAVIVEAAVRLAREGRRPTQSAILDAVAAKGVTSVRTVQRHWPAVRSALAAVNRAVPGAAAQPETGAARSPSDDLETVQAPGTMDTAASTSPVVADPEHHRPRYPSQDCLDVEEYIRRFTARGDDVEFVAALFGLDQADVEALLATEAA